jgi:hypothetical protein
MIKNKEDIKKDTVIINKTRNGDRYYTIVLNVKDGYVYSKKGGVMPLGFYLNKHNFSIKG